MFTTEQLEGIIVSLANPEIDITRDVKRAIGYNVRLRIMFRAKNPKFLLKLQETLTEIGIDSYYKGIEKKARPHPLLRLTNIDNLLLFCSLLPDSPTSNDRFKVFREALTIVSNKHHLRQKGFEQLLKLKGLLT